MKSQEDENIIQEKQKVTIPIVEFEKISEYCLNSPSSFENLGRNFLLNESTKGQSDQDIKQFEQFFLKQFLKMYQQNLLDGQCKMLLTQLINTHLYKYSKNDMYILKGVKFQGPLQNMIKCENRPLKQQQDDSLINKKKCTQLSSKDNADKTILCHKGHRLFSNFLNKSMKRLNIENTIKSFCKQVKAWSTDKSSGYNIDSFIKKLITIKCIFPQYFVKISNQFLKMIQQFKLQETKDEVQKYGKAKLIPRYQNCVKVYTESNDVSKAAEFLYKKSIQSSIFKAKIALFKNYQIQMKDKALKFQAQNHCML